MLLYLGIGIRVVVTYKHAAGDTGPYLRVLLGNTAVSVSTSMLIDGTAGLSNEVTFDAVATITFQDCPPQNEGVMSTHQNCDVTVGSHFGPFWEGHSEENAPFRLRRDIQRFNIIRILTFQI